jgi:hypothetical protein
MKLSLSNSIILTVVVAVGTLIALAVAGLFVKQKYEETASSNPLLSWLAR